MPRSINKNKNKSSRKKQRRRPRKTSRKTSRKRSLKGGDQTTVQQIMVDNLCKGTNNGGSIKGENQAASVHIENICSTSSRNNYNDTYNNSSNNSSNTSNISGGSIISKLASVASYPLRTGVSLVKRITGLDIGSIKDRIMGQSQENNIGEQITNRIST
jgi:hypothetical protein